MDEQTTQDTETCQAGDSYLEWLDKHVPYPPPTALEGRRRWGKAWKREAKLYGRNATAAARYMRLHPAQVRHILLGTRNPSDPTAFGMLRALLIKWRREHLTRSRV